MRGRRELSSEVMFLRRPSMLHVIAWLHDTSLLHDIAWLIARTGLVLAGLLVCG
jgi:hypothetical protein